MPLPKQKFREIVFQYLYSSDIGSPSEEEIIPLLMRELSVTKKAVREAVEKGKLVIAKLPEIDLLIEKFSTTYRFDRIRSVERNALRLGVYEIVYDDSIPPKVAIAEAMRLSRKFATPEAGAFVNALLDAVYKSSIGEEVDKVLLQESAKGLLESEEASKENSEIIHETQKDGSVE